MEQLIASLVKKILELGNDNTPAIRQKRVNEALEMVAEIIQNRRPYSGRD